MYMDCAAENPEEEEWCLLRMILAVVMLML